MTAPGFDPVPQDGMLSVLDRVSREIAAASHRAARIRRRHAERHRTAERRAARIRKAFSRSILAGVSL